MNLLPPIRFGVGMAIGVVIYVLVQVASNRVVRWAREDRQRPAQEAAVAAARRARYAAMRAERAQVIDLPQPATEAAVHQAGRRRPSPRLVDRTNIPTSKAS